MRVRTHATKHTTTVDGSIAASLAEHDGVTAFVLNVVGQRADSGAFMVANVTLSLDEAQALANTINAALASHAAKLARKACEQG